MLLEYQIVGIKEKDVLIKISKQEFRGTEFFYSGSPFLTHRFKGENMILESCGFPEYQGSCPNVVFVRGSATSRDDELIILPLKLFCDFKKTVEEYNQMDGRKER